MSIEGGVIPLSTENIIPVAGDVKAQFGLKYLKPRGKPQLDEVKEKEKKILQDRPVEVEKEEDRSPKSEELKKKRKTK